MNFPTLILLPGTAKHLTVDKYGEVHAPMGHEPTASLFSLFEIGGFGRREQEQFAQVMLCVKRLLLTSVILVLGLILTLVKWLRLWRTVLL